MEQKEEIKQKDVDDSQKKEDTQKRVIIKPSPIAQGKLAVKILQLVNQAMNYKQLKKGANEVMKCLAKGESQIVILAADCDPIEIIMNIPGICEEKNVPYCFVPSQSMLGRACGIQRGVVSCNVVSREGSQLNSQILEMKDAIEQLII